MYYNNRCLPFTCSGLNVVDCSKENGCTYFSLGCAESCSTYGEESECESHLLNCNYIS